MMTLGRTRFNNPIGIDWLEQVDGKIIPIFQEFDRKEESYDAWALYGALAVRALHREDTSIFLELYEKGDSHYGKEILTESDIEEMDKALGITNSCERGNYGRSLLNPEFKE